MSLRERFRPDLGDAAVVLISFRQERAPRLPRLGDREDRDRPRLGAGRTLRAGAAPFHLEERSVPLPESLTARLHSASVGVAEEAASSGVAEEEAALVAAVRAGDESAFVVLAERYRRQLHVHCYRMLGSFDEAEDVVQETFLRAWKARHSFEGRSSFRTWLYAIATNACLNALERSPRRILVPDVPPTDPSRRLSREERPDLGASLADLPWLEPYPDRLLDEAASERTEPQAAIEARETIELSYLAAIQHLPPRQRAVFILRDAYGWSASETATLLGTSVPSVNSALQRARATMQRSFPANRSEWA